MRNTAGMIFHPPNLETVDNAIKELYPIANIVYSRIPSFRKKVLLNGMSHLKIFHLKNIAFQEKDRIDLAGYMLPMLPEKMLTSSVTAIKKIDQIINRAAQEGVNVITLGAFTSIITNQGLDVNQRARVSVTSGNTCTAALCVQSLLRLESILELELIHSSMAIIGATGDIGSICAKIFVRKVKKIILCSRSVSAEQDWIKILRNEFGERIIVNQDINKVIKDADIVICATSSISTLFDIKEFLPGTIVCDLSMPPNVGRSIKHMRKDVFVYEGGRARLPNFKDIKNKHWNHLFPRNSIYGCFIESIILCLANKLESFSIGKGNITEEKINEIWKLSSMYGIETADFGIEEYVYSDKDIEEFKIKRKTYVRS